MNDLASQTTAYPSITVVICTHQRPELLARCIESLCRNDYSNFEILVVDNRPGNDRSSRRVAERFGVRYIEEPVLGLSRARNTGARATTAEVVAYIDDDAIAESGWLQAMASEFADPCVGVVTGPALPLKVETESERVADALRATSPPLRKIITRYTQGWYIETNFGGAGDGMNMGFRRECFDRWGGFSERLGRGATIDSLEEHYAFFQLVELGYTLVYSPKVAVRHPYKVFLHEMRARMRQDIRGASAYITMLFMEHPVHRRELLGYVFRGARRLATSETSVGRPQVLPMIDTLSAWMSGPLLYLQSLMSMRGPISQKTAKNRPL